MFCKWKCVPAKIITLHITQHTIRNFPLYFDKYSSYQTIFGTNVVDFNEVCILWLVINHLFLCWAILRHMIKVDLNFISSESRPISIRHELKLNSPDIFQCGLQIQIHFPVVPLLSSRHSTSSGTHCVLSPRLNQQPTDVVALSGCSLDTSSVFLVTLLSRRVQSGYKGHEDTEWKWKAQFTVSRRL
jgi:hypothetical protein